MRIEELDYDLPPQRIATAPAEPRDSAKLLVAHRTDNRVEHRHVRDLPTLVATSVNAVLRPGDLMVFNQTRVLPAHFVATRRATGGKVEGLYLQNASDAPNQWRLMLESRGTLRPGEAIDLDDSSHLQLLERLGGGAWLAQLHSPLATLDLLQRIGTPPLPPYIRKQRRLRTETEDQPADRDRYNTVYATDPGSVAAPTAGLHFTPPLLEALDRAGIQRATVTLHVGLGTFAPVRVDVVEDHQIHGEWMHVSPQTLRAIHDTRKRGGRIIPVGTTTVRALESLPHDWADHLDAGVSMETFLYITDGYAFRFTDGLMTNFHLPRSTLLAMVAALPHVGIERLLAWYRHAIDAEYRFYSYGDAMLVV